MITLKTSKRKALIFILLALILVFLAVIYSNNNISPRNFKSQINQVQNTLIEKQNDLDNLISKIDLNVAKDEDHLFQYMDKFLDELNSSENEILIYRNDYLIYWSSNSVPIFENFLENDFDQELKKLQNAWYIIHMKKSDEYVIIGLIKIKNEYAYENEFLQNEYQKDFKIHSNILISTVENDFNLYNNQGEFLFSLELPHELESGESEYLILFLLYLIAYCFLVASFYNIYLHVGSLFTNKKLVLIAFIADLLILRFVLYYFKIPHILYSTDLLSPVFYASSTIFHSLGDLIINIITITAIAYAVYRYGVKRLIRPPKSPTNRVLISVIYLICFWVLYFLLATQFKNIVVNSSISYSLSDITSINLYSILGFGCMGLMLLSFVLLTINAGLQLPALLKSKLAFFGIILLVGIAGSIILSFYWDFEYLYAIFLLAYLSSFWFIRHSESQNIQFSTSIFFLILFSLFSTYLLYQNIYEKEKEDRILIAQKLAEENNPLIEYMFSQNIHHIQNDASLSSFLHSYPFPQEINLNNTIDYLKEKYFSQHWERYDILITICDSTRELEIQPEDYIINCDEYFQNIINDFGKPIGKSNLYYLDYDYTADNYLGILDVQSGNSKLRIYIEIFSKYLPKGLGYPELLIDKETRKSAEWSEYSWARYENNELVYNFGKYFYSIDLKNYGSFSNEITFIDRNGYDHLYYPINDNTAIIISNKRADLLDIVAPFSYLLIFYGLLLFIVLLIFRSPVDMRLFDLSFRKRLQFSITLLILASFLLIGVGSLFYIIGLNNNKNKDILSEKANSVLIELEHKLAGEDKLTHEMEKYLSGLLYKFSLVFFSDINLYDLDGTLLASSRPELFNNGLLSIKMNAQAFKYIRHQKKSLFIHNESIGDYEFMSAYLPFRNDQNQLIAYLNLPYFAKQDELTNEISAFLVAFINVYVIFIAFSIFIALVISNYITKPVQLIKEKISHLKLGKTNEKIEWRNNDEIGSLVEEYNRMVDELANSAMLLAKSERESAWREMAKQIAHEIKNPLTPMKLSVQYLQKAWDENTPEWDKRLKRFTQTISEQIDSLSIIASEFSDFAKMPKSKFEKVDLEEVIRSSAGIFKDITTINIKIENEKNHFVKADKEQLLRVFNNLFKNSIQAIIKTDEGIIDISLKTQYQQHIVVFTDNGQGISEEQRDKVFSPNFTTKSGGMGLGLAMVKNIIQNAGGEISFESKTGIGTTFTISFPELKS